MAASTVALGRPFALGRGPWTTFDPFLFCVHHDDKFPKSAANSVGPDAKLLQGRELTMDFSYKDGWSMYHGTELPGFPAHPHRGFETVTAVMTGLVDHFDSMGATGRYGFGDVQWMTAGDGVQHSEMMPLVNKDKPNPLELFQIWLNLPAAKKCAKPHFEMFWAPEVPKLKVGDSDAVVVAGSGLGPTPKNPPPESWAADPENEVAIWILTMDKKGGKIVLPPAKGGADINRALYYFRGNAKSVSVQAAGTAEGAASATTINQREGIKIDASKGCEITASADGVAEILVLQGRPIKEPVVQRGPFVASSQEELMRTYKMYSATQFGGWPWPSLDHHHPREQQRFARRPGSDKDEYPPTAAADTKSTTSAANKAPK